MVHQYSSTGKAAAWKKSDFRMIDNLSIAVHAFSVRMLTSLSVDELLLPRYVN